MHFKSCKPYILSFLLTLALLGGMLSPAPTTRALAASQAPLSSSTIQSISQSDQCKPNTGWMWTTGPSEPDVAAQVQQELSRKGIDATVEAGSYGETDSCGTYNHQGIDFKVSLKDHRSNQRSSQQGLVDNILPILDKFGRPRLGNVKLVSADGDQIPVDTSGKLSITTTQALAAESLPADAITKQVYVIVYDPLLGNGQKLSQYLNWNDQAAITQQTIEFFKQATNNKMNYVVANTTIVTSGWPELIDGFTYTEQEYLAVMANSNLHHEPTGVNYNKIVNSPEFDICGKLNRGEIDEVWIYNGPWFGFYESTLVGPGAYAFNSPPVGGTHNCNKILPIMGPSPERTVNEAVHNFGHRTEATMSKVYGSWQENNTSHNWNKFALVKAQSPNYSYSGCGSTHYPPNGTSDYNYTNSSSVLSNCNDFANYPNLGDPLQVVQPVACSAWGCMELNYYGYWFGHIPAYQGCGPDNVANDWWKYIANPGVGLYPSHACQADMHLISGNAVAGGATLTYTDGSLKTVTTDASGNYFLMVSNHWSGTVTPSKANYTFTPANKTYSDVQSDLFSQDYTAQRGAYYVNIVTGNNSNSCTAIATPCRNIQEAINKAGDGDVIKVANGTYVFSTNPTPNVVIINKNLTLSGGWSPDFTSQTGASIIDGANVNNGILSISGTVTVENFIVEKSTSSNSGAIYIVNGNFTLKKSTLRNNVATSNGAGIFLDNGVLNVINSTISGNTANSSGGGIYASNNGGASVTIQNSTIAYNHASTGGGISRTNGTYNITNTIIANNTSSTSNPDCSGTIAVANFNIIENTVGCSITSGNNNLNVDPQIDSNLTGVMQVHMPLAGSPAINAGTASGCPSTDQLGTARPQGSSCDIGSIEYLIGTSTPTFTPTFTPTHTPTPTFTTTASPTPVTNCNQITTRPITISGNSMSMTITNPLTVPIQIQDVFVIWNHDTGHMVGSDKTLKLNSLSLGSQFWSGTSDGPTLTITPTSTTYIPIGTSEITFTFHQSYDNFDGTEQIIINLATNGCQSYPIISSSIATNTPTPTNTFTPTVTPPYSYNPLYLSFTSSQTIGGISSSDEDIWKFDGQNWSLFFDGSDVGVASPDMFAFSFLDPDSILMSFSTAVTINGLAVTPQDIVRFDATRLGSVTTGAFSMYLDGSDVGLDVSGDSIDSVSLLPDGRILISTTGNPVVPGVSGKDEDVLAFTPTALGDITSGIWAMYFDGSDVGLAETSNEDVDALDVTSNGYIYLSTLGDFAVSGLAGADEDVFVCIPTSLGDLTACNYSPSLYFDGSTWGLSGNDVDAFNYLASDPVPTVVVSDTPTHTPTPSLTPSPTRTPTRTPSPTPTFTRTATATSTAGPSLTPTNTPTFTPTFTATATSTKTATSTTGPSLTPTNTPSATLQPLYLSLSSGSTAGGVAAADVDILYFNGTSWSMFFDASDVGILDGTPDQDLNDFYLVDADTILMSFNTPFTLGTLSVDPWDVLQFDATSLGANTAGTFSLYFDGSDVGLDDSVNEVLDGLEILPDGRLLLSANGSFILPGLSGKDEDLLTFIPNSLGENTSGSWAMYFDGSLLGLGDSAEDIDAVTIAPSGDIYLSAADPFAVTGVAGEDEDVFLCTPTFTAGMVSACVYSSTLYFDGSLWGLSANDLDGIDLP